ncbi:MAG TPA: hypothetical protein VF941_18755 [Clostridia bacterium]
MTAYLKDKRLQDAVVEIIEGNVVLDKQLFDFLLESIYETVNKPLKII